MPSPDTFYRKTRKGIGKVCVRVGFDTLCSRAVTEAFKSRVSITACDGTCERVLYLHDAPGAPIGTALTDSGREFCARPDQHPCDLLPGERTAVVGRQTWHACSTEVQREVDASVGY